MQAVDTDGVEPLAHPIEQIMAIAQPLREDIVTEHDQRDAYLKNAPAEHDGLFLVPKVIEWVGTPKPLLNYQNHFIQKKWAAKSSRITF